MRRSNRVVDTRFAACTPGGGKSRPRDLELVMREARGVVRSRCGWRARRQVRFEFTPQLGQRLSKHTLEGERSEKRQVAGCRVRECWQCRHAIALRKKRMKAETVRVRRLARR